MFRIIVTATGILAIILTSACEPSNNSRHREGPGAPATPGEPGETPVTDARVVYAAGWQEIEMIANWAKTKVGVAGHFSTSRNACGKDEYGALDLDLWNTLAESANAALKEEPLTEDYCVKLPEGVPGERYRVMDGVAEVILENGGKRFLFETKGSEACTRLGNREAAAKLLEQLHKVVILADEEGCPNGWGSGLY